MAKKLVLVAKSDEAESKLLALFNVARADTSGRPERFNAVVDGMHRTYREDVVGLARRKVPEARVDEVVSATWEAVRHALETFKGESSFYTWLLHVAAYKAIDEQRKGKDAQREKLSGVLKGMAGQAPSAQRPSREVGRAERDDLLNGIVGKLDMDEQVLLLRHYQDGESIADIAKELGVDANVLAQRFVRLRRRLKKALEEAGISRA